CGTSSTTSAASGRPRATDGSDDRSPTRSGRRLRRPGSPSDFHAMKIVVADDLPPSALDLLRAESGWDVDARTRRSPAALAADLADADALLVRSATKVDVRLLEAAPHLRIVARAGTGVDNVDVDTATARGVLVVNAPGANSISVAEHACALMLAL